MVRGAFARATALLVLGLFSACDTEPAQAATHETSAEPRIVDRSDLSAMRRRGYLRIAVLPQSPVPIQRAATPAGRDQFLAERFARSLGLAVRWIPTEARDELMDLVERGEADLAAGNLTVTESRRRRLAFARPTRTVDEVLVGKKGVAGHPRDLGELRGRKVYVWENSSYAESLREAGAEVVAMRPDLDDETLLHLVSSAGMPLTVVDSDILDAVAEVEDRLERLCTVKAGRQIAWALRQENPELLAAANAFVVERALDGPVGEEATGDLEQIQERGVLRVLTRNNSVSYFLHRGSSFGFDYEIAQAIAKALDLRLEMRVPPRAADLIPWLEQGRGDLILASFTASPERAARIAFTKPYLFVDEVLVARAGHAPVTAISDIGRGAIHVRASSSYAQTLRALGVPFESADESLETEDLIDLVGKGRLPMTVTDSHILDVELGLRDDVAQVMQLTHAPAGARDTIGKPRSEARPIAMGVRRDSPELLAELNRMVQRGFRGARYNVAKWRYFDRRTTSAAFHKRTGGDGISEFDPLFRKYAARYGLDWRLVAAQAWQESRFDPNAKSFSGARGLMQVMTPTGREMGFTDLEDPEVSCHAGVKYLAKQIACFDETLPLEERIRFALASYNGGRGHVLDARRLAARRGLDPDVWFDNVETAILWKMDRRVARETRYGYCRGTEIVGYVRNIEARYREYVALVPKSP